jgi:hypothetical protein
MNRKRVEFAVVLLACVVATGYVSAQAKPTPQTPPPAVDPWYSRQAKPQNFDLPMVFTNAFSIQLPKDWQLAPGHTGTVFSVVQKTRGQWGVGALITLQYIRLQAPSDPAAIAVTRDYELQEVQTNEMYGKEFSAVIKNGPVGQIIFIQYVRPGLRAGVQDQVVQYSIPLGSVMYRLTCVAPVSAIETYRPIFAHVAASFTPVKASGS